MFAEAVVPPILEGLPLFADLPKAAGFIDSTFLLLVYSNQVLSQRTSWSIPPSMPTCHKLVHYNSLSNFLNLWCLFGEVSVCSDVESPQVLSKIIHDLLRVLPTVVKQLCLYRSALDRSETFLPLMSGSYSFGLVSMIGRRLLHYLEVLLQGTPTYGSHPTL